mmetsp:Transcript_30107/g.33632  ORF Transcript_30107/g.33632 Transcript_30107/m.33632 type:complete len:169 (+) Transcript_30107:462-968(+)
MKFLYEVSLKQDKNKMSATNLAIVFAPNLIRTREETYEIILTHSTLVNSLMTLLIKRYPQIFEGKELVSADPNEGEAKKPELIPLNKIQTMQRLDNKGAFGFGVFDFDDLLPTETWSSKSETTWSPAPPVKRKKSKSRKTKRKSTAIAKKNPHAKSKSSQHTKQHVRG